MPQGTDRIEPRRRRWWRTALYLVPAAIVLTLLWAYHCVDSAPPKDADLRLPVVEIPDEENGLVLLTQAAAEIQWPDDVIVAEVEGGESVTQGDQLPEYASGRGWDQKLVSETLAHNRSLLETLDRAAEAARFAWQPVTGINDRNYLAGVSELRRACLLAALRVGERRAAGDHRGALEAALRFSRLGQRFEETSGLVIHYLIGSGIASVARSRLIQLVTDLQVDVVDWQRAVRELEKQVPRGDVLRPTIQAEYAYSSLALDAIAAGSMWLDAGNLGLSGSSPPVWPWSSRCFLLPNHSKRHLGEMCRTIIAASPPGGPWLPVPWEGLGKPKPNRWAPGRNGVGRHVVSGCIHAYRELLERYQVHQLARDFLRLTVALKGFQFDHARLPEKLDELVPDWLAAVPRDSFDDHPLRYDRSRRLLWSIGRDLKDAGGVVELDADKDPLDLKLDEPTLQLPFE